MAVGNGRRPTLLMVGKKRQRRQNKSGKAWLGAMEAEFTRSSGQFDGPCFTAERGSNMDPQILV
jgi:hypothetical protein